MSDDHLSTPRGRSPGGRRVLITGFEPFDRETVNPSWEAARALDGWQSSGATVHARCMPCVFGAALLALDAAISELQPDLVIGVGQAGGRSDISLERVAINIDDGRIVDNAGQQPIDSPVIAGAPAAYFSTLPIKAMVRDLKAAGIPASVSNTAGTFVCNHLFYGLMHRLAIGQETTTGSESLSARGGFVHIPYLPEQAARQPGQASMALATLVDALRIVVATGLAVRRDIAESGGRLH